ncbi:MAG: metallophosphoesterase, partial [Kiritimatiellae bacterium]|nr:metallophosphoesterase [Kiritimatiellia bacterium]
KKPFSALHFSDTHIAMSDARDILACEERSLKVYEDRRTRFPISLQALAATIAYAERGNMPLFNTGDLIDYDSHANVECIANSFADRNILSALGNHESFGHRSKGLNPSTPEEARALLEKYEKAYRQPLIVASKVINGVNFVAFDNGGLERYFLERRLAAIRAEFGKGLPVVLLCHIPLNNKDLDAPAVNGVKGDSFMNELRAHKNQIKAILCGHGHRERLGEWNGIPVALAGANFEGSAREIEFI